MKKANNLIISPLFLSFLIIFLLCTPVHGAGKFNPITVKLKNTLHLLRNDQLIALPISAIKEHHKDFDENNFLIKSNGKSLPFDLIRNNDEDADIVFQISFQPDEQKQISISYTKNISMLKNKRTQAYLGIKTNYSMKNGVYTGGKFESTNHVSVPKKNFPHDALYQMEGPAWEYDKVAYRFYLDERNRTDIFGKSTPKMVLNIVDKNDLLSGNESYEYPLWWGQDIFKVGNSLVLVLSALS